MSLLQNKVALIYGAYGGIGTEISYAFARAGAHVFLTGRTKSKLDKIANEIRAEGGTAETARLNALDEQAVNAFVKKVAKQTGHIDISFNVIGVGDVQKPLTEITVEEFVQPINNAMRTQFITTRAVVPYMIKQKSGVILTFGGGGPQTAPGLGGFKIALDAMAGLRRQWAVELGENNIRVITIKTGGIPESISDDPETVRAIANSITKDTLLKRAATLADVGNVATFLASDHARSITATEVNISAGAMVE
jgi:3-oxoacyl-[acyl-carrier protein] reductase